MAAKEQWLSGDIALARDTLANAFNANADSENIFLAAFKLEFENDELERARFILDKARASDSSSTQRVWMKSAIVERELGDALAEARVLKEGLAKFPYFDKLWLMLGQLEERQGKLDAARQVCCCHYVSCVYSRLRSVACICLSQVCTMQTLIPMSELCGNAHVLNNAVCCC
jgi:pre-mRNA-processing factor 6